jgi:hypothetical protein
VPSVHQMETFPAPAAAGPSLVVLPAVPTALAVSSPTTTGSLSRSTSCDGAALLPSRLWLWLWLRLAVAARAAMASTAAAAPWLRATDRMRRLQRSGTSK